MMNDQIGIFPGVPFDEYAKIDALNGSSLVHMKRSPMYYRWCLDNPQPATPAQILGTATHQLILEPEKVGDFAVWGEIPEHRTDKGNMRPRNGKDWEAFKAANAGKTLVTADERDAMVGMATQARVNPLIRKYAFAKGDTEVVMVWRDQSSGRLMKGRCDKIIRDTTTIIDLKTTRDCHSYKFGGQAFALSYHIKAAIYVSGYQALTGDRPKFKFLAIDSKPPYESAVYRATPDVILQGGEDWLALMHKLDECEASGNWPPEQDEETDLILPNYAYTGDDDFAELALNTEGE
jgi:hypothetical protein